MSEQKPPHRLDRYIRAGRYLRPACSCGWTGPRYATKRTAAFSFRAHVAGMAYAEARRRALLST